MTKIFYDELKAETCDKMAQSISDMTYSYKETVVPKKHYKGLLSKRVEEIVADSVAISMTNAYFKTLNEFNKGNRSWFVSALLYIELGINPAKASSQTMVNVDKLTNAVVSGTALLNPALLDAYKDMMADE